MSSRIEGGNIPTIADAATNAFSKKIENHVAAIALHYMHYNFCRIHQAPRVTPAMEAGLTDHVWTLPGLLASA